MSKGAQKEESISSGGYFVPSSKYLFFYVTVCECSGNHGRGEFSELGGHENRTEGASSIQLDLQEGTYPDFLKIEDQQRSSINSGRVNTGLKKISPITALQPSTFGKNGSSLNVADF